MEKTAYAFHPETGEFIGEVECQPNPMLPFEHIIPAYATAVKPPRRRAAKFRSWNGTEWVYVDIDSGDETPSDETIEE